MRTPDKTSAPHRFIDWLPSLVWMGVIFWLSSLSSTGLPSGWSGPGHFTVYAVLGVLVFRALTGELGPAKAIVCAVLISSAYGITDEFHQAFVPGRMPDVVDWGLDTLGALAGALVAAGVLRISGHPDTVER
jgi:VanZ family protein